MTVEQGLKVNFFRGLGRGYLRRRYSVLFYSLIVTMAAGPVFAAIGVRDEFIELFLALNLIAAVVPVGVGNKRRLLLLIFFSAWFIRVSTHLFAETALSSASLMTWTIVALFAAARALGFAMRAVSVKTEHLYAALSAYLLAGIFFGLLYWAIEQISPGTFSGASEFSLNGAIYFSFVTLATLGYGDIAPRTEVARGLAIVEGVGGQLFLVVLVARLVSLYGREKRTNG